MGVCIQGLFFFLEGGDESITVSSQHPSESEKKKKKSLGKVLHITKHDLLKHKEGQLLCLLWVIRVQQWVKELNDRRILTELAHCSVTEFDRLIVCFSAVMSFTVCV